MDLTDYREQINNIDDQICKLFTQRMQVVNHIGEYKRDHDVPVNSGSREREVLARISKQLPEDLEDFGRVLYRSMFDISKAYEAMYKEKDSPLYACLGAERIPVNSYHHQAVRQVADGLQVMASAPDGLAEALYRPGSRFLWALQWHPEFSFRTDGNSRKIFRAFVSSME